MSLDVSLQYRPDDLIGGRYFVQQAIAGGTSEVYLCLDVTSLLPYALKTPRAALVTADVLRAFVDEAVAWLSLGAHPNIVRCYQIAMFGDRPCMLLEWPDAVVKWAGNRPRVDSEARSLRELLKDGPLSERQAVEVAIDLCRGLTHAESVRPGIVHGDLKPENILVSAEGVARLIDFGGYRVRQASNIQVAGSPATMAPEQWLGQAVDGRTDLYGLGCVLFELLSGHPLYQSNRLEELRELHLAGAPPALPAGGVPLGQLIARCLAREPAARPSGAAELLEALLELYRAAFGPPPERAPTPFTSADYLNRGAAFLNAARYDEAAADFQQVLSQTPEELSAWVMLGISRHFQERRDEAMIALERALRIDPSSYEAIFFLGQIYFDAGRDDEAEALFDRAIALSPRGHHAYVLRGHLHVRRGDDARAIADYTAAIQLAPPQARPLRQRAACYRRTGQLAAAIADLEQLIELMPSDATAYASRGRLYAEDGNAEAAIADYSTALQLDPDNPAYLFERGSIASRHGHYAEALHDLERAGERAPDDAQIALERAVALHGLGQSELALTLLSQLSKRWPDLVAPHLERGDILVHLDRVDEAEHAYSTGLSIDPGNIALRRKRGGLCLQLGRHAECIADLSLVLATDPDDQLCVLMRGLAHEQIGDLRAAEADFGRALALNPNDPDALAARARILQASGRPDQALGDAGYAQRLDRSLGRPLLERRLAVLEAFPGLEQQPRALAEWALLAQECGDSERAAQAAARALAAEPGLVAARLVLVRHNETRGEHAEACAGYSALIKDRPRLRPVPLHGPAPAQYQLDEVPLYVDDNAEAFSEDWLRLDIDLRLARARLLAQLGQPAEALAEYEQVAAEFPHVWQAQLGLLELYRGQGRLAEAARAAEQAMRHRPDDSDLIVIYGWAQLDLGQVAEARQAFEQALSLTPQQPGALVGLARIACTTPAAGAALQGDMLPGEANGRVFLPSQHAGFDPRGDYQAALDYLNRASTAAPDDPVIHALRGKVLFILQRYEQALIDLSRAIELDPEDVDNYVDRGLCLSQMGRLQEAIGDYTAALRLDPQLVQARFNRGVAYVKFGQAEPALADYEAALALDPNHGEAYYNASQLLYEGDQVFDAFVYACNARARGVPNASRLIEAIVTRARQLEGNTFMLAAIALGFVERERDLLWLRGHIAELNDSQLRHRYYEDTLRQFALANLGPFRDPDFSSLPPYLEQNMAILDAADERASEGLAVFEREILAGEGQTRSSPRVRQLAGMYAHGLNLARGGDYAAALRLAEQITAASPTFASAWALIGECYDGLRSYKKAISAYDRAVELAPEDAAIIADRGDTLMNAGMVRQAIDDLSRALIFDPSHNKARSNLGWAYQRLGKHEQAIDLFTQVIREAPDLVVAYNNRGFSLQASGAYLEALRDYDTVLALDPEHAQARLNRAAIYLELGRYDVALHAYHTAVKKDLRGLFSLATAFLWLGLPELAQVYAQRAFDHIAFPITHNLMDRTRAALGATPSPPIRQARAAVLSALTAQEMRGIAERYPFVLDPAFLSDLGQYLQRPGAGVPAEQSLSATIAVELLRQLQEEQQRQPSIRWHDPAAPLRGAALAEACYINAFIAYQDSDVALGLEQIEQAIGHRPDMADAYVLRALLYHESGEPTHALADLDRACALHPGHTWAEDERRRLKSAT